MEQDTTAGNAVALGLSLYLKIPLLLLLSDVLAVLGKCLDVFSQTYSQ